MKKKQNILIVLAFLFVIFFTIGGHFINKRHHNKVRSMPQMYCYHTFYGPPNPVLMIENLKYKNAYVKYYNKVEKGENPTFDFPLKTMPQNEPVYVMGYTQDSLLANVVSYYDRGSRFGGSYTRAWVYTKTLNETPPSMHRKKIE